MGTKTISVREEAYDRLVKARKAPGESFSEVILRARWDSEPLRAGAYLAMVRERGPVYPESALDSIEELNRSDRPARDKWARD